MNVPCSMVSYPARRAFLMPSVARQWPVTFSRWLWAVATTACISSNVMQSVWWSFVSGAAASPVG